MKTTKLEGTVLRIAKLNVPSRMEFTLRVKTTTIDETVFTIADEVCCEVDTFHTQKPDIIKTITNLAVGDGILVTMTKIDGVWQVTGLQHKPKRGRAVGDFLAAIEEKMARRKL